MIHATAIVDKNAFIGLGSSVGPWSVIGPKVKIGKDNIIGPHVVIEGDTTMGDANRVFQFASIGSEPQDLKCQGTPGKLVIGNSNIIRECVTIQPGTRVDGVTSIGDGNLFMAYSHIAHDCIVKNNCWLANSAALGGYVTVGYGVILGGLSGVHQFCAVGDYAFISAGSIVTQDVPPYCTVQGDRASLVCVNKVGLLRNGFSSDQISLVESLFKQLFMSDGILKNKTELLLKNYSDTKIAKDFIDFVINSKRGIPRLRLGNANN